MQADAQRVRSPMASRNPHSRLTVAESVERFLIHRAKSKNLRVEISLLVGPRSGRVVGKKAQAPALAVEHGSLPVHRLSAEVLAAWETRRNGPLPHNRQRGDRFVLRHY